jgi:hypothetical protein
MTTQNPEHLFSPLGGPGASSIVSGYPCRWVIRPTEERSINNFRNYYYINWSTSFKTYYSKKHLCVHAPTHTVSSFIKWCCMNYTTYVASNDRMIINNELGRTWKEIIEAYFTILTRHLTRVERCRWVIRNSSYSGKCEFDAPSGSQKPERSSTVLGWMTGVQFSARTMMGYFSLRHRVQTGSGAQQASYPAGTGGLHPRGKATWAWSWPLTSI